MTPTTRHSGRPTLRWTRVRSDPRISYLHQMYSIEHGGRSYRLLLTLTAGTGKLEDWSAHPRVLVSTFPARTSREGQRLGETHLLRYAATFRMAGAETAPDQKGSFPKPLPLPTGPHPLVRLKLHLSRLNHVALRGKVDEYLSIVGDEREVHRLADLLRQADWALTGQETAAERHTIAARATLEGTPTTLPLSDGGYSRLHLAVLEEPQMKLDRSFSSTRALETWDSIFSRGL